MRLTELKWNDIYGGDFEAFRKKYNKVKSDVDLFVHFSNYRNHPDNKTAHANTDHTDPMGVYAYPLKYVIDHPADIWYGANAKFLMVMRRTDAAKTLYLQDMTEDRMITILRDMGLYARVSDAEDAIKTARRIERYTGTKALHKAFMTVVQMGLTDDEKSINEYARSSTEQTRLFLRAGYTALQDDARSINTAIINDREPSQICFLRRDAFVSEEVFQLTNPTRPATKYDNLVTNNKGDDPAFRRKVAALIMAGMKDKLVSGKNEYPHSTVWFGKGGTRLELKFDNNIDREDLKFGQKKHKANKLTDGVYLSGIAHTPYGKVRIHGSGDDDVAGWVNDATAVYNIAKRKGELDPDFVAYTEAEYNAKLKEINDAEVKARLQKEREAELAEARKYVDEYWSDVVEVVKELTGKVIPSEVDDENAIRLHYHIYKITRLLNYEKLDAVREYPAELMEKYEHFMTEYGHERGSRISGSLYKIPVGEHAGTIQAVVDTLLEFETVRGDTSRPRYIGIPLFKAINEVLKATHEA